MNSHLWSGFGLHALIPLILAPVCTVAARADAIYTLSVDTSSISGISGSIDLQFDGSPESPDAGATISAFASDGILGPQGSSAGNFSGQLPGSVTLTINGTFQANEYNQIITFGSFVSFQVDLAGNPPPAGNSFALSFFNLSNTSGVLPGNFFGEVAEIDVNETNIGTQIFGPSTSIVSASNTPEPGGLLLFFGALAGWVIQIKRKRDLL